MSTNFFSSILEEAPTEVAKLLPVPIGTYVCVIKPFELPTRDNGPGRYPLQIVSALDDVDPDAIEEIGGVEGKFLSYQVWPDERAKRLVDLIQEAAGIDFTIPATREQRNDDIVGAQILASVSHRVDKTDPNKVYTQVDKVAAI